MSPNSPTPQLLNSPHYPIPSLPTTQLHCTLPTPPHNPLPHSPIHPLTHSLLIHSLTTHTLTNLPIHPFSLSHTHPINHCPTLSSIPLLTHSPSHPLLYSHTPLLIHTLPYSLTHTSTHSHTPQLTLTLTPIPMAQLMFHTLSKLRPPTYPPTHHLSHSLTHPLTHSLTSGQHGQFDRDIPRPGAAPGRPAPDRGGTGVSKEGVAGGPPCHWCQHAQFGRDIPRPGAAPLTGGGNPQCHTMGSGLLLSRALPADHPCLMTARHKLHICQQRMLSFSETVCVSVAPLLCRPTACNRSPETLY